MVVLHAIKLINAQLVYQVLINQITHVHQYAIPLNIIVLN